MSLQAALDAYRAQAKAGGDPEAQAVIDSAIREVARAGSGLSQPVIGDPFPVLALPSALGGDFSLISAWRRGPLVVSFYRGLWCPYCNLEMAALEKIHSWIMEAGGMLVAVSPQSAAGSRAAMRRMSLSFPILVDDLNRAADLVGIRHEVSGALRALYLSNGIDLETINAGGDWSLPMPSRFVIGQNGKVAASNTNPDYRIRPEPEETLEIVRRLSPHTLRPTQHPE